MFTFKPVAPILAACFLVASPLSTVALADQQRSFKSLTIAISDVKGEDDEICAAIYDSFRSRVISMNRFTVLERDDARMKQLIREAAFGASGMVNSASAPRIGQMLGAGYLTFIDYRNFVVSFERPVKKGDKGVYKCQLTATARFVNTETGVAASAFTAKGSGSNANRGQAVREAIDNVVREMVLSTREVFALRGSILQLDGKDVAVSLGQQHGVHKGTYFNVMREINGIPKKVGMIRVDDVGADKSSATVTEGFWNVRRGDFLEEKVRTSSPFGIGAFYEFASMPTAVGLQSAGVLSIDKASIFGIELKAPDLFSDSAGLSLGAGYVAPIAGRGLGGFVVDLTGHYRWEVIPEWFAFDFRLGPTLGGFGQDRNNFDRVLLSGNASQSTDSPSGLGFGGVAGVNGVLLLGHNFRLQAGVGYRILSPVSEWSVGSTKDGTNETLRDPNGIAYPSVGINGITFQGGIEGQF